jgi:hypothetical protein
MIGACQPALAAAAMATSSRVPINQVVMQIQMSLQQLAVRAHIHVPLPDILFHGLFDWVKELLFQHLILTGYWDAVKNSHGVAPIPNPFPQLAAGAAA